MADQRVQFDFEIEFSNGGGLRGEGFRLDIEGDDIADEALADYLVRDMRLLMVGTVRIRNKRILAEAHKRPARAETPRRLVDVSHDVEHGMVTYRGLPAPVICDFLSREESRRHYAPGTEFHIGKIEMVANTGTYLDSPFHRYADGRDLAGLPLESAGRPARASWCGRRASRAAGSTRRPLAGLDVRGKAVLVHTGWDVHWRTERYFEGHPFLTAGRPPNGWPGRRGAGRDRLAEHRRHRGPAAARAHARCSGPTSRSSSTCAGSGACPRRASGSSPCR